MVVVGGMGNIWGAVLGAILLTWLPEWLTVAAEYDIMVYGLLLMLVMIFIPDGLVGRFSRLVERITSKDTGDSPTNSSRGMGDFSHSTDMQAEESD